MTDKELKKSLKKLGIILILVIILILLLSFYTLSSAKAKLSICSNTDYENSTQALGIEEEELKQYLAAFGFLVKEDLDTDLQTFQMATYFIDHLCAANDTGENENVKKSYDASLINQVVKELNGTFWKDNKDRGEYYLYQKEANNYQQNKVIEEMPYCTKIEKITKQEDKIVISYQLAYMTQEQVAEYITGKEIQVNTQNVQAVIMRNTDYEYAKYFVSKIEKK